MFRSLLIPFLLLFATAAFADPIAGQASVIDGDTLEIHGQRIRLNGIDAPESRQPCERPDGSDYRCGQLAAFALTDWIGRSTVICAPTGRDRYRRVLATCFAREQDIGQWMVRQGHALAFRRYSTIYVSDEDDSRRSSRGMWQGRFVTPWDWRSGTR